MSPYGNTCPCLKIAREFYTNYAVTLEICDLYLRAIPISDDTARLIAGIPPEQHRAICDAVYEVAQDTKAAWQRGIDNGTQDPPPLWIDARRSP